MGRSHPALPYADRRLGGRELKLAAWLRPQPPLGRDPRYHSCLVKAAREAREAFGTQAEEQLADTLAVVDRVASSLGVPLDGGAHAFLDARSVSLSGGTVSLHDGRGVPLTGLGTGSSRLLVAGLQREAAPQAGIVLVDEIEHGLEPHRIIGLLGSLGAKEKAPPCRSSPRPIHPSPCANWQRGSSTSSAEMRRGATR